MMRSVPAVKTQKNAVYNTTTRAGQSVTAHAGDAALGPAQVGRTGPLELCGCHTRVIAAPPMNHRLLEMVSVSVLRRSRCQSTPLPGRGHDQHRPLLASTRLPPASARILPEGSQAVGRAQNRMMRFAAIPFWRSTPVNCSCPSGCDVSGAEPQDWLWTSRSTGERASVTGVLNHTKLHNMTLKGRNVARCAAPVPGTGFHGCI
jgi:hypothetical protein